MYFFNLLLQKLRGCKKIQHIEIGSSVKVTRKICKHSTIFFRVLQFGVAICDAIRADTSTHVTLDKARTYDHMTIIC
jgi:hypothetical protein